MERSRPGRTDDLDRLVELAELARREFSAERGGEIWARRESAPWPRRDELAAALTDPSAQLQVGCIDEYPVGYGLVRLETLRTGELLAVAGDIFVEAPFRGVAVGELIMDELIAWSKRQGCIGIDSLVLPGMRDSKNFFERYGMKARALLVHLSFATEEP